MEYILDFEKPIRELEARIAETRRLAEQTGLDISSSLAPLEARLEQLKQDIYRNLTPWQRVQLARHPARPYALDYIHAITEDFVELHGDRCGGDDKAIVGGVGKIGPYGVILIGQQKGRDTRTRQYRNFGMPNPEGYRKARRLMKLAEKLHKPVISFIDTPGAHPGTHAEEFGQAESIARNLYEMAQLQVPILVFIVGEGASGGALGIGVGDKIYMLENTWYSVISPESCASILWRSWEYKEKAAEALHLSAQDNLKLGTIDEIIPEPLGGAHQNPTVVYKAVREKILQDLPPLLALSGEELVQRRLEKYSRMGRWVEKASAV
ncbi:MAG: acetyl-CoA carboxylase carboxyltransferase subunit alpha [Bacteroidia bacterium]|nr:acetyl-CoA carboxylase carboxyltransferase subunit alpha [Bacteroidia bacterium]MDW8088565.1 acetyl-CoA carboxylase carboxyltransferase subunit alpha [Bacteroidia bacterium]